MAKYGSALSRMALRRIQFELLDCALGNQVDLTPDDAREFLFHRNEWSGVGTKLGTIAKRRLEINFSNRRIYLKCEMTDPRHR